MARIHPGFPIHHPLSAGGYREREVLKVLGTELPDSFDLFHNLPWSSHEAGQQSFGEYDFVLVSPQGQILILEIKAGEVIVGDEGLAKQYSHQGPKNIGHQMRRMHSHLLDRMRQGDLPTVRISSVLILPDFRISSNIVSYPREHIIDADQMPELSQRIKSYFGVDAISEDQRQRLMHFFSNRFEVVPDVATHVGQMQSVSTQLSSGLATWVPKIQHSTQAYVIEATAGSGKTQLALTLLRQANEAKLKARYVCFNRPLADHLAHLAPAQVEVTTFHQLCRDHAEKSGQTLDFSDPTVFERMTQQYIEASETLEKRLDLLIIDEAQDLRADWVNALLQSLKDDGRLYVMGDHSQQLYERDSFDLPDAVKIDCLDNFRSPRALVKLINHLRLTPQMIQARSPYSGEFPETYTWRADKSDAIRLVDQCLSRLWQLGYKPDQVVVLSYRGFASSEVLKQTQLGGQATRRFMGQYDTAGNPIWSQGELMAESLYRFKGQSAPAVVLCEVDFTELNEQEKKKLFVALTRAQMHLQIVISPQSYGILAPLI